MPQPQPLPIVTLETFSDALQPAFAALNREWIEKYFELEPTDREQLDQPRRHIIDAGGEIFVLLENGVAKGTCAMCRVDERTFELAKMAVSPSSQGRGYGHRLMEAAITFARARGAARLDSSGAAVAVDLQVTGAGADHHLLDTRGIGIAGALRAEFAVVIPG